MTSGCHQAIPSLSSGCHLPVICLSSACHKVLFGTDRAGAKNPNSPSCHCAIDQLLHFFLLRSATENAPCMNRRVVLAVCLLGGAVAIFARYSWRHEDSPSGGPVRSSTGDAYDVQPRLTTITDGRTLDHSTTPTRPGRAPLRHVDPLGAARCLTVPFLVMSDVTVCPYVLNLCVSMIASGFTIGNGTNRNGDTQDPNRAAVASCVAHLDATVKVHEECAEAECDPVELRARVLSLGGCLHVTFRPPLASLREYPRMLMSKAGSWWQWYRALANFTHVTHVAFVDADVEVFPGVIPALGLWRQEWFGSHHMLFMRDQDDKDPRRKSGNAGFFIVPMRNTIAARALEDMARRSAQLLKTLTPDELAAKYPGGDQHVVYEMLRDGLRRFGLRWRSLPRSAVTDGRAKIYWRSAIIHHPHMSGAYKPVNMRRLIAFKRDEAAATTSAAPPHEGSCLPTDGIVNSTACSGGPAVCARVTGPSYL
jgi:hypothetical protein